MTFKKWISFAAVLVAVISLAGCGKKEAKDSSEIPLCLIGIPDIDHSLGLFIRNLTLKLSKMGIPIFLYARK